MIAHRLVFACSLASLCLSGSSSAQPVLESAFEHPPAEARPHTWWHWMNGNVSREGITADLEAMKQIGLGGAQIFNVSEGIPDGPIAYNTPEWRGLVKFAASEAQRLGLELCIHNCAGWSSSGGPWITPEYAMQMLTTSEVKVKGPAKFRDSLPQPKTNAGYYRDIVTLAFPTPKNDAYRIPDIGAKALREYKYGLPPSMDEVPEDAVIDPKSVIELKSADGKVEWDAPAGDWTVMRIGHTPTGAVNAPAPLSGRGLEVDKLSREAFDAYWAGGMAPLIKELGPLAGTTLKNCLIDSYEVGCQNWTPRFRAEFGKRRQYDPLLLLPAMTGRVIGSGQATERFLWDMRRTIGDLFAENYYSYFAETCRKNGLLSSIEPYDGPFEGEQVAKDADIVMGEFWSNAGMSSSCKLAASVAHTWGKKFVGAESFTAFPDPMGQWGTHFERTTTWWGQGSAWITYLTRCQSMLQQGRFVADVCYFAGDASPNGAPFEPELKAKGYDYDTLGTDALRDRMTVKEGRIVLPDGLSYRAMVLPDSPVLTRESTMRIAALVRAGATVIGPKPVYSPSAMTGPTAIDKEMTSIAEETWGNCDGKTTKEHAAGKGHVVWGKTVEEVLAGMKVEPDFTAASVSGAAPGVAWIHRETDGADIYFVSNQKSRSVEVECSFRVTGRTPELWHADTGVMEPAPIWSVKGTRTVVTTRFDPSGSVFVIFRAPTKGTVAAHVVAVKPPQTIEQERRTPKIEIKKAVYEAVDGAGGADVTAKVVALVEQGETEITANNGLFGDPTYNHAKRLRVDYTVDGKPISKSAAENAILVLVDTSGPDSPLWYAVGVNPAGRGELFAFRDGAYEVSRSDGKVSTLTIKPLPASIVVGAPWTVKFQGGRGAPASASFDSLISWTASANTGVKYFSGTAEYEQVFDVPASSVGPKFVHRLDLGTVKEIAEVTLNGTKLGEGGVWWKPPFEADVTGLIKVGKNTLQVRVTNTWVNRLIGDEQFPDDSEWNGITIKKWPEWFKPASDNPLLARPVKDRLTFTTWKHWHKDSTPLESGLIGPVRIRTGERVELTN